MTSPTSEEWRGPLSIALEVPRNVSQPVHSIRYLTIGQAERFDFYLPRKFFGTAGGPSRVTLTLEGIGDPYAQLPPWRYPETTLDYVATGAVRRTMRYDAPDATDTPGPFTLYVPWTVFGDQHPPRIIRATITVRTREPSRHGGAIPAVATRHNTPRLMIRALITS